MGNKQLNKYHVIRLIMLFLTPLRSLLVYFIGPAHMVLEKGKRESNFFLKIPWDMFQPNCGKFWFCFSVVFFFFKKGFRSSRDVRLRPGQDTPEMSQMQGWDWAKKEREEECLEMRKGIHVRLSWACSPSRPQLSLKVFPLLASLWFWLPNPHILQ